MTHTSETDLEAELRQLFAEIPPPPLRAIDQRSSSPAESHRPRWRNHWVIPGIALGSAAAVVVAFSATRGTTPSGPVAKPAASMGAQLVVKVQLAGADLACSLPISALSADHTVGFVHVQGGSATFEPVRTSGYTYAPGLRRWINELPQAVSPDGLAYFTQDENAQTGDLRVVDASGERSLGRHPGAMGWYGHEIVVASFDSRPASGVILATTSLSLVDSVTGATRALAGPPPSIGSGDLGPGGSATGYVPSTHALWTAINHRDGTTTVDAYDLATQATTRWFRASGFVQVVGADRAGLPIVQNTDRDIAHVDPTKRAGISTRTLLLTAPNRETVLNSGRTGEANVADNLSPLSATDGDAVWMAGDNGQVWRYTPATGMQMVLKVTTSTRGAPGVVISGPCR